MVRIYPGEETANINAANVSMQRGDLQSAAKFLERAGNSIEAEYARGNLACLVETAKGYEKRDYSQAIQFFERVKSEANNALSIKASDALQRIEEMPK